MFLKDKDLMSVQEVRELISIAKEAQKELATKDQAYVDRIIQAIADAGVRNAERLGRMAWEETGFGIPADKTIKNVFGSKNVYEYIKDLKTVGVINRDEKLGITEIGIPVGVIAGIIPSTNPTSTTLYKAIISIKSGNGIVFSPHPAALKCILETVKVIRQAIAHVGANPDLVQCVSIPTRQATDVLMSCSDTALILATGGSAMVRSAYSSGTPAIGVGPGNGPAFIDQSADLKLAVKRIMDSKTFDNGTICASEQSIICTPEMAPKVQAEMTAQGAYFLSDAEREQLGKFILRANGTMNPQIVGKSVKTIVELAGLTNVPATARVLVAKEDGVGFGHPYSNEKLGPILGFYTADTVEKICECCAEILYYEGAGHTMSMHTNNPEQVSYFAARVPVSRLIVNTPATLGGIGATTGLMPALTLGCGAVGGSATGDNVGPLNLMNIRRVAFGKGEIEDVRAAVANAAGTGSSCSAPVAGNIDIDDIVNKIIARLNG